MWAVRQTHSSDKNKDSWLMCELWTLFGHNLVSHAMAHPTLAAVCAESSRVELRCAESHCTESTPTQFTMFSGTEFYALTYDVWRFLRIFKSNFRNCRVLEYPLRYSNGYPIPKLPDSGNPSQSQVQRVSGAKGMEYIIQLCTDRGNVVALGLLYMHPLPVGRNNLITSL